MNYQEELTQIARHLRRLTMLSESLGFEPPALSPSALSYLARKHPRMGSLDHLREYIGECTRCKLCKGRKKVVFGEGSGKARLVFVGEAPGREEDVEGRPFVGEAGRLLTKIIENGMGIGRKEVYICNVIKCRPPNNRDPEKEEIETCFPFLEEQIRIINPEVICALGRVAAQELSGRECHITKDRGQWFSYSDIPVMPTFHPAYLLRNPSAKRDVWEDAKKIMKRLGLEVKRNG